MNASTIEALCFNMTIKVLHFDITIETLQILDVNNLMTLKAL